MKLLIPILPGVLGQFSFMSPMHTSFNAATDTLGVGNQYHTQAQTSYNNPLSYGNVYGNNQKRYNGAFGGRNLIGNQGYNSGMNSM